MSEEHDRMVEALKAIVVPKLREKGFRGSFPHFRRKSLEEIDLLTFQFDRYGGGFFLEISKCPLDGITTYWGEHILPNKVTAKYMHPDKTLRLHPKHDYGSSPEDWFRYDRTIRSGDIYEKTARAVLPFLEEAEKWWKAN
jgi:hypothetical protein